MSDERKIRFVQAAFGAVILTLLMQPVFIIGYAEYVWLIFLPLVLFFALGADFKKIPSMIVCYICGVLWAMINGAIGGVFESFLPFEVANLITTILVIFCILTIHENFLAKTIFGNVPALFLGLATTFFTFFIVPSNAEPITPIHLVLLFIYGIVLTCALVGGGFAVCSMIFGKERVLAVFAGSEKSDKSKKNSKSKNMESM